MAHRILNVFSDASVQPHATGLGVVVKDVCGRLIAWHCRGARPMTCNEAEYAALIFALDFALSFPAEEVRVFSDSRLVIEQMTGLNDVRSDELRRLHRRARALAARYGSIRFAHIPRERNRLADAMANDAIAGRRPAGEGGRRAYQHVRGRELRRGR